MSKKHRLEFITSLAFLLLLFGNRSVAEPQTHKRVPNNVHIILDCSSSMGQAFSGKVTKIDLAKLLIARIVKELPQSTNLAFRVFGQNKTGDKFMDCKCSALLVPSGQGNRRTLIERMRNIQAFGLSPTTYALRQGLENDLAGVNGKKTLLLLCDGGDTCEEDPASFVSSVNIASEGLDFKIVSLVPKDYAFDLKAVQKIAEKTNGKLYPPSSIDELIRDLSQ